VRLAVILLGAVLAAQTRLSVRDLGVSGNGALLVTADGLRAADVSPGYAYEAGGTRAQLLAGWCGTDHRVSERPIDAGGGRWRFAVRPSGISVAVYRGGLRLTPDAHYRLWWTDPAQLPDGIEILAGAPGDGGDVVVDYQAGSGGVPTP